MDSWEARLVTALNNDSSVWSIAEAMTLIEGAKDAARHIPDLFDWNSQAFTDAGQKWIAGQVL